MSGCDDDLEILLKLQLKRFQEFFDNVDTDGNGSLQFSEICTLLRNAGFKGSDADIMKVFQFADTNKDSKISRNEYMTAVKKAPQINLNEILLRRAFRRFDKDGSGFLTKDEIIEISGSQDVALKVNHKKISDLLVAMCQGGDNKVDYEEFLECFRKANK